MTFGMFLLMPSVSHADEFSQLAKDLAQGASELKYKKVAVLTFPYHDGRMSSGSSIVSERLTTDLVGKKKLRVIERRLIEQLLTEKKLSEEGVVNQENLKTLGTVLDVDAIVTGTLIDLENNRTEINARMIRSDSGEVLSVGQVIVDRTWKDEPVSPRPAAKIKRVAASPAPAPAPPPLLDDIDPSSAKSPVKLSNESFPPSRRIYHTVGYGEPKKKPEIEKMSPGRDDQDHEKVEEPIVIRNETKQKEAPTKPPPPPPGRRR